MLLYHSRHKFFMEKYRFFPHLLWKYVNIDVLWEYHVLEIISGSWRTFTELHMIMDGLLIGYNYEGEGLSFEDIN